MRFRLALPTALLVVGFLSFATLPAATPVRKPVASAAANVHLPTRLPPHPRLLFTKEALPEIRQRAEKTDWGRAAYAKIQRNADKWLTKEVALPDRGGQWPLWYACKKDGAPLKTQSPTKHVCTVCGEVYSGWPYDDVLVGRTHGELSQALLDCGIAFQVKGDARYAAKAKEILLAYAAKYQSYPLHNNNGEPKVGGGHIMSQTLDEASWFFPVTQGADLVWETLTEAEREAVAKGLFLPGSETIRTHRMKVHNIQCFKNSAVGLIGFLLGDSKLITDAVADPEHGYLTQMAQGVSPEGVWYEGSWGYHTMTMGGLWPLTEAARNCGLNLYGPELKRMFEAPLQLAMPNGTFPAFNDSKEFSLRGNAVWEVGLARYGDPRFATVLATSDRKSLLPLILGVSELPKAATAAMPSHNYTVAGYAVLRHGEGEQATWLAMKYGPHGGGHGHPDKLSFVLYSQGQVIAVDPGCVAYSAPIHKEWYRTTVAHNTLVTDGQSQAEATGQSLGFIASEKINAALADAGPIYPGVRFRRAVALFGDDLVLVVDQISGTSPHTYDLAYHNRGTFDVQPTGSRISMPSLPGYMHLQNTVTAEARGSFSTVFNLDGGLSTRFTTLVPSGGQIILGTGVGKNRSDRVPMALLRVKTAEFVVGWALTIGKKDAAAPVLQLRRDASGALEATLGERKCLLVSNPELRHILLGKKAYNTPLICFEKQGDSITFEEAEPTTAVGTRR